MQLGEVVLLALLQLVAVVGALSQQPLQHLQQGRSEALAGSVTSVRESKRPAAPSSSQWDGAGAQQNFVQGTKLPEWHTTVSEEAEDGAHLCVLLTVLLILLMQPRPLLAHEGQMPFPASLASPLRASRATC